MKRKIYFFDKGVFNPYRMSNVKISVNQVKKEGTIFFKEDFFNEKDKRSWEVRYDNSYPTLFYDEKLKKYRCYYSTFTTDEESSKYSLDERKKIDYKPKSDRIVSLCYAESDDGINWIKPNLYLIEFEGSKENNIIGHYLHGTSVLYDKTELDEKKRYKMFTKIDYGNGVHYMAVAFSSNGINFDNFIKCDDFNPRGDTYNQVYYDENLREYVLITRTWRDSIRIACISKSKDFIHWSPIEELNLDRGFESQVYSMPFFRKGDYLIGLASMFHEGDRMAEEFDKVDVDLTYSYRYKGWHYVDTTKKFIPRGKGDYYTQGEFDCGCIYATTPVEIGDRTYFYYMGGNGQHTNFREGSFSRAYIEKDRYAYIEQKNSEYEGIASTNGFIFLSNEIYIDADIEKDGYIKINLFENNHTKIEDVKVELIKKEDKYQLIFDKDIRRRLMRFEITFKNAKIYSIEGDLDVYRVELAGALLRV